MSSTYGFKSRLPHQRRAGRKTCSFVFVRRDGRRTRITRQTNVSNWRSAFAEKTCRDGFYLGKPFLFLTVKYKSFTLYPFRSIYGVSFNL